MNLIRQYKLHLLGVIIEDNYLLEIIKCVEGIFNRLNHATYQSKNPNIIPNYVCYVDVNDEYKEYLIPEKETGILWCRNKYFWNDLIKIMHQDDIKVLIRMMAQHHFKLGHLEPKPQQIDVKIMASPTDYIIYAK